MTKGRLEAFSDGVIAIIITIMVLEMKVPHATDMAALRPILPVFLSYALSFIYVGIYWNNHHHLFHLVRHVDGRIMWANLHLLFWLSLIPFVTGWMGENHFDRLPVAFYGVVLFCAGVAFFILTRALLARHGQGSALDRALANNRKEKISMAVYALGVVMAFVHVWIAQAMYVAIAILWLIPDRRVERTLAESRAESRAESPVGD
jgi:uncharacterized membrane protein